MTLQQCKPQGSAAGRRNRALAAAITATLSANAAFAAPQTNTSAGAPNTQNTPSTNTGNLPADSISLSGSTAIRNYTVSGGMTLLQPGTSITLLNGPSGMTTTYTAPSGTSTVVQLASPNFTAADSPQPLSFGTVSNATMQTHSAIAQTWHEQGSVEGILDLANDQIGYAGGFQVGDPNHIYLGSRNPTQGNPIWINQNKFLAAGTTNGFTIANQATYNTYDNTQFNLATGQNLVGGQDRVQMAISDVNHVQGFSISGANGSIGSTPLSAGYGKGNNNIGLAQGTELSNSTLATPGTFYQLPDSTVLNMPTSNINPQTGAAYTSGPWNSAGVNNLDSKRVAVTATLMVANPGTGLLRINSGDAQFLQAESRLANGAEFNMTTRDLRSGTRNTFANNTGLDPSWAVGKNDAGNANDLTAGQSANDQTNIGGAQNTANANAAGAISAQLFSNKTSGGSSLRPTVQNNRMSLGTLSMSDAIGSTKNSVATPLRSLAYADTAGQGAGAAYVAASAQSIVNGTYAPFQNEQYVTVKNPDASFVGNQAGWNAATTSTSVSGTTTTIKGDNSNHDVAQVRDNILNSVAAFPATSTGDPADVMLNNSLMLPQWLVNEKSVDGINKTSPNPSYNMAQSNAFLASAALTAKFNPADPSTVTSGASATYDNALGGSSNAPTGTNAINITSQNYLFGNFNQNGTRDFSAVKTALTAAKALYNAGNAADTFHGTNMFSNATLANNAVVATGVAALDAMTNQQGGVGATKGDLIVMGDFTGSGQFNGASLYALAHGAALSDASGAGFTNGTLTAASGADLGDQLRNGVLRKNAALDYMQANTADATYTGNTPTNASAYLRQTAIRTNLPGGVAATNDPQGANAFNKFDVNGDGKVDINDVKVLDYFDHYDYTNLNQQLSATINSDGTRPPTNPAPGTQVPFKLVDAQVYDAGDVTPSGATHGTIVTLDDLKAVESAAGVTFKAGDANFDGHVGSDDVVALLNHYGETNAHGVSDGDFNYDGSVGSDDVVTLLNNYGTALMPGDLQMINKLMAMADFSPAEMASYDAKLEAIPEPSSFGLLACGAAGLLARRRRRL